MVYGTDKSGWYSSCRILFSKRSLCNRIAEKEQQQLQFYEKKMPQDIPAALDRDTAFCFDSRSGHDNLSYGRLFRKQHDSKVSAEYGSDSGA